MENGHSLQKINDKTIDDKYPIPNIMDILDKLGRSNYFTTLDLASGFHQIEIDKKDVEKTAFKKCSINVCQNNGLNP